MALMDDLQSLNWPQLKLKLGLYRHAPARWLTPATDARPVIDVARFKCREPTTPHIFRANEELFRDRDGELWLITYKPRFQLVPSWRERAIAHWRRYRRDYLYAAAGFALYFYLIAKAQP
jgi:hypothetical protein